jgi:hypothetical protein
MLAYDVFTSDAFSVAEVREAANDIYYIPQALNELNLFTPDPIRTTEVMITKRGESLVLVPTTERGSPRTRSEKDRRNIRKIPTVSLRQEDSIKADELQNIAAEGMPFSDALDNSWDEVDRRQRKLMRKLELTSEYHRLAGIQGYCLDADGSIIMDFYDEFGLARPGNVAIDVTLNEGDLRESVVQNVTRPITRQLSVSGRNAPTQIIALCGDAFFDALVKAEEIRQVYLNSQRLVDSLLEGAAAWDRFRFAGVTWMNFRGTNDGTTIAIPDDECIFVPLGVEDMFVEFRAPGENWDEVNQPGEEFYSYVIPDPRSAVSEVLMYVDVWLDKHFLFACLAPDALLHGELQ